MKWFKHMSDASDDEFIAELEAQLGLEGYARWWKLLEAIAKQMDKSSRCDASYPVAKWMIILGCKQRRVLETFVKVLENFGKISTKHQQNILQITCPKLLEFRDEYSRKSGVTPDKVAPDTEEEVDTEEERKKEELPFPLFQLGENPMPEAALPGDGFEEFRQIYPKQRAGSWEAAKKAYSKALKRSTMEEIIQGTMRYAESDEVKRGFAKGAAAWLNDDRWKNDYSVKPKPNANFNPDIRPGTPTKSRKTVA